jgi:hypothetical protein
LCKRIEEKSTHNTYPILKKSIDEAQNDAFKINSDFENKAINAQKSVKEFIDSTKGVISKRIEGHKQSSATKEKQKPNLRPKN